MAEVSTSAHRLLLHGAQGLCDEDSPLSKMAKSSLFDINIFREVFEMARYRFLVLGAGTKTCIARGTKSKLTCLPRVQFQASHLFYYRIVHFSPE